MARRRAASASRSKGHLRQVEPVDVLHLGVHHEAFDIFIVLRVLDVGTGGSRGQPATVTAHDLVNHQRARRSTLFIADMVEEVCANFGRSPGSQRLLDGNDIIINRLRQADHSQVVAVCAEIGGKVGGGGVGVVATDRMQDRHPIGGEPVSCNLQRVLAFLDKAPLHAVRSIGQLDAAVANWGTAIAVKQMRLFTHVLVDFDSIAKQQSLIARAVGNQLDLWRDIGIALNETADCR